uniref:Ion transport domain-containing protein n=1 Tax=Hemiselmis andersenii TaxID=464988 RepID=A0A7S0TWC5_HEMAN
MLTTEKLVFVCRTLNIIDLISIIPTWVSLGVKEFSWGSLLRVLRVLRVFKLARHSGGLQVLAETAIAARNELFQVFFCFSILVILFAAVVYYTEEQDPIEPHFQSIPHSMWWAVITLCTIGYGDMVPNTGLGQAVGAMACVSGVVMVALPISVISSTFTAKFQEHTERKKLLEAQAARVKDTKARDQRESQKSMDSQNEGTGTFVRKLQSAWVRRSSKTSSKLVGGRTGARAPTTGNAGNASQSLDMVWSGEAENHENVGGSINVFQRALSVGAAARTDAENARRSSLGDGG